MNILSEEIKKVQIKFTIELDPGEFDKLLSLAIIANDPDAYDSEEDYYDDKQFLNDLFNKFEKVKHKIFEE